jgi:hypothetical protein
METYEEMLERVRALPAMTEEERIEQTIDFVWGNLMASTNHRPTVTKEEFAAQMRELITPKKAAPSCPNNTAGDPWCKCGKCCDERAGIEPGVWP